MAIRGPAAWRWYARFLRDPVGCMAETHDRYGSLIVLGGGRNEGKRRRHIGALGAEWNRQVFGNPADFRTSAWGFRGRPGTALNRLHSGINTMNGTQHRDQRGMIMPMFRKQAVDAYLPHMVDVTSHIMGQWRRGETVDLWQQMRLLSLRLSSQFLFAREDPEKASALGELLEQWLHESYFNMGAQIFPHDLPLTPYRRLCRHAQRVERALQEMIQDRRESMSRNPSVLDSLIRAHDEGAAGASDASLLGQANFLFAASYETTATSLTWALFLLAQHPQIAADLYDEIVGKFGEEPPISDQLDELPLLDAVVKETLRILPPVPLTGRTATRSVQLGDVSLREGDRLYLSQYVTHHCADTYPNPQRFHPARWFTIQPSNYEYLPFGAGPRTCVGLYLGMKIIKLVLAISLQRWRLETVAETRIDRSVKVTMRPKRGLPMVVHVPGGKGRVANVSGNIHEMVDLIPSETPTISVAAAAKMNRPPRYAAPQQAA